MVPTLEVGQRVLVNRIGHRFSDPKVGDIVVFHPPVGSETDTCGDRNRDENAACDEPTPGLAKVNFIKRVVAGPGDVIRIVDGHVIRNGRRERDAYISHTCDNNANRGCTMSTPITIPPGHWFMMGDNRGESDDSRFWGPVPRSAIIGGAFATYWPPSRIGLL
jgi:signal peptidase I